MEIKIVSDQSQLEKIKILQEQNLRSALTIAEAAKEGFLTAEYSIEFLEKMHDATPSIIVMDGDVLAGYALATTKEVGIHHNLIKDLFAAIDRISYESTMLKDRAYIIIGQLCVAKNYRGMGLVQKMYNTFRDEYAVAYEYCLTDVAEDNPRSLKAHLKSGFQVVDTLRYGGIGWDIVLWDWRFTVV